MNEVVGRDTALLAIDRWLERPQPAVLLIEGEAGIGKTTLWRAALDRARGRGLRILSCSAAQEETTISFTALRDLLGEPFDEVADELPAPQRRAVEIALLREEPQAAPPEQGAIAVAFLSALRALGAREPTVLAIDDVQWLDPASARPLQYALRRLDGERVSALLARRVGEASPTVAQQLEPELVEILRVGPLSIGAIGRILHERMGGLFTRPTLHRLHETSAGNPFFALELARALARNPPAPGGALPVPPSLRQLVEERMTALPQKTLSALVLASATARPSLELLDAALERPAAPDLAPAEDAQVVEIQGNSVRFTHPFFAAFAYESASHARRRAAHRRLAGVVRDQEERARHLALATDVPDEEVARLVHEGARAAFVRGAPAAAAELLELALRVTPSKPRQPLLRRNAELAECHLLTRNVGDAIRLLEEVVDELPPGGQRAEALLKLSWAYQREDLQRSRALGEAALVDAEGDDARVAQIECHLSSVLFVLGFPTRSAEHARAAVRAAERSGQDGPLSQALTVLAWVETMGIVEADPEVLERALELEQAGREAGPMVNRPRLLLGVRHMYAGRLDEAREQLELKVAEAVSAGDESGQSALLHLLTELECRAGDWEVASRHAARAAELGQLIEQEQALSMLPYVRALVATHLGRVEPARTEIALTIELAQRSGGEFFRVQALALLGFLELSLGEYAAADRILRPLADQLATSGWREPGVSGELPNAIEALVELGELDEARRLLAELQGRLAAIESPWAEASALRCRGLVLDATGDLEGALRALEQALDVHERLPQPFDRARTLLAFGSVQRRSRQRRAGRETLSSALAIFEELGAELWAAKARAELRRIGGRARSEGGLTPTEERVAELVAAGKSNKEVAAELIVSVHTIEAALTSIYRKLDVRSRTEMARKLRGTEAVRR